MGDFITIPEFSGLIGVPMPTIYAWAKQNIIRTTRHGNRLWVNKQDIPEIIARYTIYQEFKIKK